MSYLFHLPCALPSFVHYAQRLRTACERSARRYVAICRNIIEYRLCDTRDRTFFNNSRAFCNSPPIDALDRESSHSAQGFVTEAVAE